MSHAPSDVAAGNCGLDLMFASGASDDNLRGRDLSWLSRGTGYNWSPEVPLGSRVCLDAGDDGAGLRGTAPPGRDVPAPPAARSYAPTHRTGPRGVLAHGCVGGRAV